MKRLWGCKVSDLGYYSFAQIFQHLARKEGKEVRQTGRYFASSQTCSGCGSKTETGFVKNAAALMTVM